jgi:hypothetical protein
MVRLMYTTAPGPIRNVLDAETLYFGDGGTCYCGDHHGATARATGRDLSGQRVERVTAAMAASEGLTFRCELPSCGRRVEGGGR